MRIMGFQRRAQHQPIIHAKGMYTSLPTYVTMMNKNLVLMIGVSSLSTVSAPAYIQHVESKFFDILKWSDVLSYSYVYYVRLLLCQEILYYVKRLRIFSSFYKSKLDHRFFVICSIPLCLSYLRAPI